MKRNFLLILVIILFTSGCAPTIFYQLYNTESDSQITKTESDLIFENDEIRIVYNFWSENGNSSFFLFNKTNEDIFLDLEKSHLIINDLATTYYQNRVFTSTSISGIRLSNPYSTYGQSTILNNVNFEKGSSISVSEERIVCIPPKAGKYIRGFLLNASLYFNCDLTRYPKKISETMKFDKESSPLRIRNIITLRYDETDTSNQVQLEHNFWASEVLNLNKKEFVKSQYDYYCGRRSGTRSFYYPYAQPDKFYIKFGL